MSELMDEIENKFSAEKEKINAEAKANAQMKELAIIATDPTKTVATKVSQKVAQKIETDPDTQLKIDNTSQRIVDSSLNEIEQRAKTAQDLTAKDNDQTFFDRHIEDLKTAGIIKITDRKIMERVVRCHKVWFNIFYYTILWWVIGINTFSSSARPLSLFAKILGIIASVLLFAALIYAIIKLPEYIVDIIAIIKNKIA